MAANAAATAGSAAAAAAEEVAGLDRVLTRLALTDDDKLQKVLQKLIPVVIGQLKSPHPATFNKVREILSHVNKRLKGLPSMQLPLAELVALYKGEPPPGTTPTQYGMVRNFSLVYAEMASERAPGPDRLTALPSLLTGLSRRPADHQAIILRIAAAALEHQPQPPVSVSANGVTIPGLTASTTAAAEAAATAPPAAAVASDDVAAAASSAAPTPPETPPVSAAEAAMRARFPYLADKADRDLFLSYGLKLMLYAPRTSRAPTTPLAIGQAAAAPAAGAVAAAATPAPPPPPPPGLSATDVKQLEAKGAPSLDQAIRRKVGLLNLLAAAGIGGPLLPVGAVLPHLLVGSVEPSEGVARRAEEVLKRSAALDPSRPAANLEDPELIRQLLKLFHGGATQLFFDGTGGDGGGGGTNTASGGTAAADHMAAPVGPALRSRLVSIFCRSILFANTFPASLLTVQECVMPPQAISGASGGGGGSGGAMTGAFARLRQQGLELCVWVFKHAPRHQLKAMGPVVLQGLLDTLDGTAPATPGAPMDSPTMTLRGFAYQAIGSLAQRVPELLQPRIDIARRFFAALSDEAPGVRAAVQEAAGALSRAFAVTQTPGPRAGAAPVETKAYGGRTAELDELLLDSVCSHKDAVRLCAVQWACRLFPFQHVPARWVCVLAAGDSKHDVREEAAKGLQPPPSAIAAVAAAAPPAKSASAASADAAVSGGGADGAAAAAAAAVAGAAATGQLPSLYDVLRYVRQRLPRLRQPAEPLAPLPLPPRSCLALIALLRACRHVASTTITSDATASGGAGAGGSGSNAAAAFGGGDSMDVDGGGGGGGGEADADEAMEAEGPEAGGFRSAASADLDPELVPYDGPALLSAYACALEAGLCRVEGSSEVAVAALEAMLEAAAEDSRGVLARRYVPRASWLRSFLSHTAPGSRVAAAKLLGSHVTPVMEQEAAEELLGGLCGQLSPLLPHLLLRGAAAGDGALVAAAATTTGYGAIKQEEADGCLLAIGLIAGNSPSLGLTATAAAVDNLAGMLRGGGGTEAAAPTLPPPPTILRATAALALSYACASGIQPALLAPAAAPAPKATAAAADGGAAMQVDGAGGAVAATAAAAAAAVPHVPPSQPQRILDVVTGSILDLLTDNDGKVVSRAAAAAGYLAGGWGGEWLAEDDFSGKLVEGLLRTATNKSEDVQFAVGEALAWAVGGLPSSVTSSTVLRGNFTALADQFTTASAAAAAISGGGDDGHGGGGEMMQVAAAAMAAEEEGRVAEAEAGLRSRVLSKLLDELVVNPRAEVRCAAAVWLVSLLGFCGRALRGAALPKIQEALSGLLGDANELTQEMASRGVSLVYHLGDAEAREQLVTRLVAVLQGGGGGGGAAGRPVKLTADTQVFEEGALGTAPGGGGGGGSSGSGGGGGGLSTYKELCALATDLGQPDLIYKFMDLAHHAAALNSRRGAAFGFAGIARLAARAGGAPGEVLAKHMAALVPKLYRYTHDPNPKVAEAMIAIWRSLVDDPRVTLDRHFPALMADLLGEMGGRLWRNRQAACSALGDLLQGRRWSELSPYFSQIWIRTFRGMDDIKESVRRAALSLARTVRGLTLRLTDPAHTPAKDCSAAVAAVMPVLLEQGLMSTVAEVRSLSVEVLGLVARTAPASALRPLLPSLVPAMLEGLSSLEDVRLNYVEQHAERLGLDSERLEGARVAAARASPLGDILELAARLADGPALEQLVPALVGTVKRGVGLNTKVGTARFIRNLASRPGAAAATAAAGTAAATAAASEQTAAAAAGGGGGATAAAEPLLRPHAGPLLRVLVGAVRSERSGTVRRAYAAAAAQVVRHAGEKRLDKFVTEAVALYTEPGADVDSRLSGALLIRELLRAAPEKLRSYDATVLPAAFGAKMDEDKEVAAVWAEVWEEGVSSEPAALRLYGKEICTTLCEMLGGQQWGRKKAAAEATTRLTEIARDALGENGRRLAMALLSELGVGRLWDGKEAVLGALAALVAADPRVMEAVPGHVAVVDALMSAVGRKKTSYRTAALAALEVVLRALPGSQYDRVAPPLLAAVARHCDAGATAMSEAPPAASTHGTPPPPNAAVTAAVDEDADRPLPLSECLSCLSAAFARVGTSGVSRAGSGTAVADEAAAALVVLKQGEGLAAALQGVLSAQIPWQPKLAAATAVHVLAQRCVATGVHPPSATSLLRSLASGLLQSAQVHKVQQFRMAALAALAALVQVAAPQPPSAAAGAAAVTATSVGPAAPVAAAASGKADVAGWSEADRRELLPGLVSGLQQLADADRSVAVMAAALGVKASLEPLLLLPAAAAAAAAGAAPSPAVATPAAAATPRTDSVMDTAS